MILGQLGPNATNSCQWVVTTWWSEVVMRLVILTRMFEGRCGGRDYRHLRFCSVWMSVWWLLIHVQGGGILPARYRTEREKKKRLEKEKSGTQADLERGAGFWEMGGCRQNRHQGLASVTRDLVSCTRGKWRDRRQKFLSTCDCCGPGWRMGPHAGHGQGPNWCTCAATNFNVVTLIVRQ